MVPRKGTTFWGKRLISTDLKEEWYNQSTTVKVEMDIKKGLSPKRESSETLEIPIT